METEHRSKGKPVQRGRSRMPDNSLFYEKVIPVLLIILGIVMIALILFAAGIAVGVIKF